MRRQPAGGGRRGGVLRSVLRGAAAGAAGTTALNAASNLDMVLRGRGTSSTPEQTVERLAELTHVPVPGSGQTRANRVAGLGPLSGLVAGVGAGAALGLLRAAGLRPGPLGGVLTATAAGLVAGNAPMTVLGITDPRSWAAADWVADVLPHLAYGLVTGPVLRGLDEA